MGIWRGTPSPSFELRYSLASRSGQVITVNTSTPVLQNGDAKPKAIDRVALMA